MPNPVTTDDIEHRLGSLPAEEEVVSALIEDAWTMLLANVSTVEERLADETLSTDLVVLVVSAMVIRVLRNPDGYRSEKSDDYAYTRDDAVSSGALYISAEEIALLTAPGVHGAAFTITPFGEPGYSTEFDAWATE